MARLVVLLVALLFTVGFALLTISAIAQRGLDVLGVASILILALFAFGILGALRGPPR